MPKLKDLNEAEDFAKTNDPFAEDFILILCQEMLGSENNSIDDQNNKNSINYKNANGKTFLHIAVENSYNQLAVVCINVFNANVQIKDNDGNTPLDIVSKEPNTYMHYLLKKNMPKEHHNTGKSEKTSLTTSRDDKIVERLGDLCITSNGDKKKTPENNNTFSGVKTKNGHTKQCKIL